MSAELNPATSERRSHTLASLTRLAPAALLVLGVLVHLLFLVSLKTGWLAPLFEDTMHRFGPGCDFFSLYAAGVKARLGQSVYTIGGHVPTVPYAYAFRYAPFVAYTLGLALSLLPAISAYGLWLILCELALLRNIRLTWERAPDPRTGLACCALWLLYTPYFLELYVGQFTFLTASLVFWAYLAWQEPGRRPRRAGDAFWALAVWLKMMPLLFLPLALLRGRWRAAALAPLLLVAGSWLYFAHFPDDWAVFQDTNLSPLPTFHAGNQGLMALLYAAVGERADAYRAARWAVLALVGAALAWLTWRAWAAIRPNKAPRKKGVRRAAAHVTRRDAERPLLSLYAALSAAYLLTYKDVWEHHSVLLLPPLVLLALRQEPAQLWLPPFVVYALPSLFALYDLPHLGYNEEPQPYWSRAVSLIQHGWKPLAPLWLMSGLLATSLRGTRVGDGFSKWREWFRPVRRVAQATVRVLLGVGLFGTAHWVRASITTQRQVARSVAWPPGVFQKQQHNNTCGPAALAAVCRHYGVPAPRTTWSPTTRTPGRAARSPTWPGRGWTGTQATKSSRRNKGHKRRRAPDFVENSAPSDLIRRRRGPCPIVRVSHGLLQVGLPLSGLPVCDDAPGDQRQTERVDRAERLEKGAVIDVEGVPRHLQKECDERDRTLHQQNGEAEAQQEVPAGGHVLACLSQTRRGEKAEHDNRDKENEVNQARDNDAQGVGRQHHTALPWSVRNALGAPAAPPGRGRGRAGRSRTEQLKPAGRRGWRRKEAWGCRKSPDPS